MWGGKEKVFVFYCLPHRPPGPPKRSNLCQHEPAAASSNLRHTAPNKVLADIMTPTQIFFSSGFRLAGCDASSPFD